MESEMRMHRCCFTGRRPQKLRRSGKEIKANLENAIQQAIADGYTTFITGMAYGVDICRSDCRPATEAKSWPSPARCPPVPGL